MTLFLMDTDLLTLYQMGHVQVVHNIVRHAVAPVAISVITVEEQLTGWQRLLRQAKDDTQRALVYERMALTVEDLAGWRVLPCSVTALTLHARLLRQRLNVGSNDLKIAATALEHNAIIVTRNRRDFNRVPGVAIVDWSV